MSEELVDVRLCREAREQERVATATPPSWLGDDQPVSQRGVGVGGRHLAGPLRPERGRVACGVESVERLVELLARQRSTQFLLRLVGHRHNDVGSSRGHRGRGGLTPTTTCERRGLRPASLTNPTPRACVAVDRGRGRRSWHDAGDVPTTAVSAAGRARAQGDESAR